MVAFPCRNGAPVKGITLSTRVGRLSRTHFELGFSVNAIVSMGRKAMERKGAWISQKVLLNNVFESAQVEAAVSSCSAVGNLFVGKVSCGTTMNQIVEKWGDSLWKNSAGTQCGVPHCFTTDLSLSSLGSE